MKKVLLFAYLFLGFFLVGCQKEVPYNLIPNSYDEEPLYEDVDDDIYTLMLAEQNSRTVLLALILKDNVFEVYRTYALPNYENEIKIVHFSMNPDKNPYVYLLIDGEINKYSATKRVGITGHYYVMELYYGFVDGFYVDIQGGCFGTGNPCPFNSKGTGFIDGPYVDYVILDMHATRPQKQRKIHPDLNQWYTLHSEDTIYRVIAIHEQKLYKLIIHFENDAVVYTATLIDDDVVFAQEINDSKTILSLHSDETYQFIYWDLTKSSKYPLEGTFVKYHQRNPHYVIETSTYFYIFNEMLITNRIERNSNHVVLSVYVNEDSLGYYYIEDNLIKKYTQNT